MLADMHVRMCLHLHNVCVYRWVVIVFMWAFSAVVVDGSIEAEGESTGGADKGQAHCPGSVEKVAHLCSLKCGHVVHRGAMFDGVVSCFSSSLCPGG